MKNIILFTFLFFCLTLWNSCVFEDPFEGLAPGKWRVHLLLDGRKNQRIDKNKRDKFQLTPKTDIMYEEVSEGEFRSHPSPGTRWDVWKSFHELRGILEAHCPISSAPHKIDVPHAVVHDARGLTKLVKFYCWKQVGGRFHQGWNICFRAGTSDSQVGQRPWASAPNRWQGLQWDETQRGQRPAYSSPN